MARLVTGEELEEDNFETSIRPESIDEYIGQSELKENLNILQTTLKLQSKTQNAVLHSLLCYTDRTVLHSTIWLWI